MKKQILLAATVLFSAGMLFITGCKKDDTSDPVVTLKGSATEKVVLNTPWTDPGATAEDDKDGVLTATPSKVVDVNKAGVYQIVYSATDAAGNTGTDTRTVTVYNEAEAVWAGTYSKASETDANGLYTYNAAKPFIVTASTTKNNRVIMNRLGDFDNNTVYMDITGSTIEIPSQTVTKVGSGTANCDVHDRKTQGSGSKTTIPNGFTLSYSDEKVAPCSGTRSGVVANFVK